MGVVSGDILVDGKERDESFQRKTGYCMQQVCLSRYAPAHRLRLPSVSIMLGRPSCHFVRSRGVGILRSIATTPTHS